MARQTVLILGLLAFLVGRPEVFASDQSPRYFANPIGEHPDPWVTRYHGHYVSCFSTKSGEILVYVSDRLEKFGPKHVVWNAPKTGLVSHQIWAPELHLLDGRWYIYFAGDDGQNKTHRAWVLQSAGSDPLGPYTLHGPLYTGDDPALKADNQWAIDMTILEMGARRYAIWSGWQGDDDNQHLYIAPLKDPLHIGAPRTRLCANDNYLWERVDDSPQGRGLNEGPETLQHAGRTFLVFSCSGSWEPTYKIGMLELKPGGDPLQPGNWKMFPKPVFQSTATTYGVGHNSFTKSPDGTQDWLVYHAKMERRHGGRRDTFAQPFTWNADGLPNFGRPVNAGQLLRVPSGE